MSTRCQIDFIYRVFNAPSTSASGEKLKLARENTVRIYRHSDGYPEGKSGIVADLKAFVSGFGHSRIGDIEYLAANYIYWKKKRAEKNYGLRAAKCGYGLCNPQNGWHGDIEYFYELVYETRPIGRSSLFLNVYEVRLNNRSQKITRESMKLLKTVSFDSLSK